MWMDAENISYFFFAFFGKVPEPASTKQNMSAFCVSHKILKPCFGDLASPLLGYNLIGNAISSSSNEIHRLLLQQICLDDFAEYTNIFVVCHFFPSWIPFGEVHPLLTTMGDNSEWLKLPIDQKCEHKVISPFSLTCTLESCLLIMQLLTHWPLFPRQHFSLTRCGKPVWVVMRRLWACTRGLTMRRVQSGANTWDWSRSLWLSPMQWLSLKASRRPWLLWRMPT